MAQLHSDTTAALASRWLMTAKLARREGLLQTAMAATLHAGDLGVVAAQLERAKCLWDEQQHPRAIQVLKAMVTALKPSSDRRVAAATELEAAMNQKVLEAASLRGKQSDMPLLAKVSRVCRPRDRRVRPAHRLKTPLADVTRERCSYIVQAQLRLARWSDLTASLSDDELICLYKSVQPPGDRCANGDVVHALEGRRPNTAALLEDGCAWPMAADRTGWEDHSFAFAFYLDKAFHQRAKSFRLTESDQALKYARSFMRSVLPVACLLTISPIDCSDSAVCQGPLARDAQALWVSTTERHQAHLSGAAASPHPVARPGRRPCEVRVGAPRPSALPACNSNPSGTRPFARLWWAAAQRGPRIRPRPTSSRTCTSPSLSR